MTQNLTMANEALANYKGDVVNPLEDKAVQKDTEASTCTNEALAPIINQVFQVNSSFLVEGLTTME